MKSWKSLLIGAVVIVAFASAAPQADAQWGYYRPAVWGYGYGYGYAASCCTPYYSTFYAPRYASVGCYSPCCGDSWYLGCRPGPVRRLLFGPYRWYWGGYADCCSVTYDSCCGDGFVVAPAAGGSPTPAPTPAKKPIAEPPMPAEPTAPDAPAPAEPAPPKATSTTPETSGVLTVLVPSDAKVTVNGLETRSNGSRRQFVSYGLQPGFTYKYVVQAQVVRNGQVQEETRTVTLTAGDITAVAFGFNTASQQVASAQ